MLDGGRRLPAAILFADSTGNSADRMFIGVRPRWRRARRLSASWRLARRRPLWSTTRRQWNHCGGVESQRAIEQNLAGCRLQQVGAAHHFGDAHGGIVGHASQLIAGHSIAAPHHEIAEIHAGDKALRPQVLIIEFNHFSIGDTEAPIDASGLFRVHAGGTGQLRSMPDRAGRCRGTWARHRGLQVCDCAAGASRAARVDVLSVGSAWRARAARSLREHLQGNRNPPLQAACAMRRDRQLRRLLCT